MQVTASHPAAALIDVSLVDGAVHYQPLEPFPAPAGAECVFLGRTRREVHAAHGELNRLSYEAYEPMAQRVLEQIAREAVERFACMAVRLWHALGEVAVGEASVIVQVVCGHRAAAFDACRFCIDELKTRAPIWKRELWTAGSTWAQGVEARR